MNSVQYLEGGWARSKCVVYVSDESIGAYRGVDSELPHDWKLWKTWWVAAVGEPVAYRAEYQCFRCGLQVEEQAPVSATDPHVPPVPQRHLNWTDPTPTELRV